MVFENRGREIEGFEKRDFKKQRGDFGEVKNREGVVEILERRVEKKKG